MCVASLLAPSDPCFGPMTIEHFWHRPGGVKGKRAPSNEQHLVVCCLHHNMHASKAMRMAYRRYIARLYFLDLEGLLRGEYEADST